MNININMGEIETAEAARDVAIDWQHWMSEQNLSYGQMAAWESDFEELAERFGLTEEFRENGIIG